MSTLEIFTDEVRKDKKLKIISEMVPLKEYIKILENKYNCSFKEFKNKIKKDAEDFQEWNDYIDSYSKK